MTTLELIEQAEQPVLVKVGAKWCGPCKMIEPIIESVAENPDYKVVSADVDDDGEQELIKTHGIQSVPTLLFFSGGDLKHKIVGRGFTKESLVSVLEGLKDGE